jgi:hypothetical protein
MESYVAIADFLKATGPYGLVVILGWAFWRVSEKKDEQMKALFDRVSALAEAQTSALVKVESALGSLREAIDGLRSNGKSTHRISLE